MPALACNILYGAVSCMRKHGLLFIILVHGARRACTAINHHYAQGIMQSGKIHMLVVDGLIYVSTGLQHLIWSCELYSVNAWYTLFLLVYKVTMWAHNKLITTSYKVTLKMYWCQDIFVCTK